jgi:uncharacterized protein YndB with AHSA1/START domain
MAGPRSISDTAVKRATGKDWAEWFALLDRAGAARMEHPAIARSLHGEHCGDWWSQMVAVEYERARGLRDVHQKPGGYAVSVSRTIAGPIELVYDAFTRPEDARKWFARGQRADVTKGGRYENGLGDRGEYRTVRRPDLLRFTWESPQAATASTVEVRLVRKGPQKTSITVEHQKIADRKAHTALQERWSTALDALRAHVESGAALPAGKAAARTPAATRRAHVARPAAVARTVKKRATAAKPKAAARKAAVAKAAKTTRAVKGKAARR